MQNEHLKSHQLVITNGKEPVAIAGVMGGLNSEVHDGTTTVVIESAYFASGICPTVRRKNLDCVVMQAHVLKKVLIRTRVIAAAERAAQLMAEIAGGEVLSWVGYC